MAVLLWFIWTAYALPALAAMRPDASRRPFAFRRRTWPVVKLVEGFNRMRSPLRRLRREKELLTGNSSGLTQQVVVSRF